MARMKGVFSWEDVLAQRYQSNKPPPLPRKRPQIQCPQPQPQSRLLARLSPELRLMIWEYVLGGQRIHIIQRSQQRLGHVLCPVPLETSSASTSPSPSSSRSASPSSASGSSSANHHSRRNTELFCEICHGGGIPQPAKEGDLARRKKSMLLGLALCCRLTYKESIQKLYTTSTLEFSNPWTASYMQPTIPTESWSSIRYVELRWSFPGHWLPSKDPVRAIYVSAGRAQWIETCVALRALAGLRAFVLVLGRTWFAEELGVLGVFLEPLFGLGVRGRNQELVVDGEGDMFSDCPWSDDGEDWCGSLGGSSRASIPSVSGGVGEHCEAAVSPTSSLFSCPSSCSSSASLASLPKSYTPDITPNTYIADMGKWELRLENQSYYTNELVKIEEDLQARGINCRITTV